MAVSCTKKQTNLLLSLPGNIHGTLILLGNSNCLGFKALAACTSISIGFSFGFFAGLPLLLLLLLLLLLPLLLGLEELAGVDELLLFRVCGIACLLADAYLQLWQSHSPVGMSFSSNGGSLRSYFVSIHLFLTLVVTVLTGTVNGS